MVANNPIPPDSGGADPLVNISDDATFDRFIPGFPARNRFTRRRWTSPGVKGPGGVRVKLRSVKVGQGIFVRPSWCRAFLAALEAEPAAVGGRDQGQAERDADVVLRAAGIG